MTQVAVCARLEPSSGPDEPRRTPRVGSVESDVSDADLMARVKAGDLTAFEQLVDRHQHALVGYLTRMTNSHDRAEEYAQEAFLRLYRNARRYDERGHLTAYLFRIATNLLRSDERRRKRWRLLEGMLARETRTAAASPQLDLLQDEVGGVVTEAIGALPQMFRAPLVLREIQGWSYADIAETLGCRVGTVKSRINRAKSRLRETLEPYWSEGR